MSALVILSFFPALARAQAPAQVSLPAFARALSWNESSQTLAASMALQGVAFIKLDEKGRPQAQAIREDWPSLYALPLEQGRFLLAGRFGELRLVEPTAAEGKDYREIKQWKVEGVPTHLARSGDHLYVAAAAAGLQVYHWPDEEADPVLRGRYPIVDYSKQMAVLGETVVLADNFDTGLQFLNVADPLRPRREAMKTGGFFDSVSSFGNVVAATNRKQGTYLFDLSDPKMPKPIGFIESESPAFGRPPDVKRVAFGPQGQLLVTEAGIDCHLYTLSRSQDGGLLVASKAKLSFPGTAVGEGIFFPDGRLALSLENGTLVIQTAP